VILLLQQRIYTAVIGVIVLLWVSVKGGWWFTAAFSILAVIGYMERVRMGKGRALAAYDCFGAVATLLFLYYGLPGDGLPVSSFFSANAPWLGVVMAAAVLMLFLIPVATRNRVSFDEVGLRFLGALYVGGLFHYSLALRLSPCGGFYPFLALLLAMWGTDTAAYFSGRVFKGPKLWPSISPNKTVSGAVGGLAGALLLDSGLAYATGGLGLGATGVTVFSLLVSAMGQLGDLVESAMKRKADVKDSGALLPGHGGVLDRFDSLLFAGPMAYHLFIAFACR
jgi:phosphatidate cytidylyltransferase